MAAVCAGFRVHRYSSRAGEVMFALLYAQHLDENLQQAATAALC